MFKNIMTGIGIVVLLAAIVVASIGIEFGGIHIKGFLDKERQNVQTDVYRSSQAYVQGKHQDLAKYYGEYTSADDMQNKAAIEAIIRTQFADFDAGTINNAAIRNFLINVRGY